MMPRAAIALYVFRRHAMLPSNAFCVDTCQPMPDSLRYIVTQIYCSAYSGPCFLIYLETRCTGTLTQIVLETNAIPV